MGSRQKSAVIDPSRVGQDEGVASVCSCVPVVGERAIHRVEPVPPCPFCLEALLGASEPGREDRPSASSSRLSFLAVGLVIRRNQERSLKPGS